MVKALPMKGKSYLKKPRRTLFLVSWPEYMNTVL